MHNYRTTSHEDSLLKDLRVDAAEHDCRMVAQCTIHNAQYIIHAHNPERRLCDCAMRISQRSERMKVE